MEYNLPSEAVTLDFPVIQAATIGFDLFPFIAMVLAVRPPSNDTARLQPPS